MWREKLQERYGNQSAHNGAGARIASVEDAIVSGKKRRTQMRMRTEALAASAEEEVGFVPLEVSRAPRAASATESSLPREDDEVGTGEDEFAEFTGATERIPLGRDAERKRKLARRRQMRSLIASVEGDDEADNDIAIVVRRPRAAAVTSQGAVPRIHDEHEDAFAMSADALPDIQVDEDDAEERVAQDAWERAQMSRMNVDINPAVEKKEDEERAPYVGARVPLVSTLPTPRSCMARLELRLVELEQHANEHVEFAKLTEAELEGVHSEERTLQTEAMDLEAKLAWFADMNTYVDALGHFFDVKMSMLEAVEHNALALLADRSVSRQRARALACEDDIALVYGVSDASMWIPRSYENSRAMNADGAWDAPLRTSRAHEWPADTSTQWLSADDVAHFDEAKLNVLDEHALIMADVQDVTFREPATSAPDGLLERFRAWRAQFPADYNLAWGGLALANAYEWYARYEMALWDPFWCNSEHDKSLGGPIDGIPGFAWEQALSAYTEEEEPRGGDDEMEATLMTKAVMPRLLMLVKHAYDPYSAKETSAALMLVEQISYVVDTGHDAFQELLNTFREVMAQHVQLLSEALHRQAPRTPKTPSTHPGIAAARYRLASLVTSLTCNVLRWHTTIKDDAYTALVCDATQCALTETSQARDAHTLTQQILSAWPHGLLPDMYEAFKTLS